MTLRLRALKPGGIAHIVTKDGFALCYLRMGAPCLSSPSQRVCQRCQQRAWRARQAGSPYLVEEGGA